MKYFLNHARSYILRGVLASIPLVLSYFVIKFLYVVVDQRLMNLVDRLIGQRIPGLGILLVLIIFYLIGFFASNVIGRKFFALLEGIFTRIPLVKTTYQIGKQFSSTLALSEKQIFKRVVFVDYFKTGTGPVGFVTGTIINHTTKETLLKVFIPTVPNPTTGFVLVLKESQVFEPGWTIEQGIKAVISGGIIGPEEMGSAKET